ncbi:Golgi protein [Trachipleistophora hominis]|uniref:Golgi protein n=1 Tax=Trachipleistophora hominis TaxID=72359 RepID=L7JXZ5_TRAHO|nr:Golgi protein [Trachipleistophora hominis]
MDESTIRRRDIQSSAKTHKFTLTEELMILSSLRKKIYKILDPLSVAIRACILADLNYQNIITMDYKKGCVVVKDTITGNVLDNPLMDDVVYRIGLYKTSVSKWIRLLNGESYKRSEYYLKKVRKRVLVGLQNKKAVKFREQVLLSGGC